jgi:uncharacterized membrane protein
MTFLFALIGAALGAFVCAGMFGEQVGGTSAVVGACIGMLLGQLRTLRRRVANLERELRERAAIAQVAEPAAAPAARAAAPPPVRVAPVVPTSPVASSEPPIVTPPPVPPTPAPIPQRAAATPPAIAARAAPAVPPRAQPAPPSKDFASQLIERVKRWFTEGNVPVKVGVIVSFFGVGALLKYAVDSGWLSVPIEFRLLGIAVAALGALVFAWRKRESHRTFALSLQGGAIGILILTIFAAFRLYALLPGLLAFVLLALVVAGAGLLAVLQDAMALAVLAIVGGFLAPILTSTGQGSHIALFGYYAVLNSTIFFIAWIKPWRALNLLGFAFTFAIGTAWGVQQYRPEFFATTEPFLLLFFAFYLLIPLLYALRQAPDKRDLIDGMLVFGTPLLALPLQAALLHGERMPLAWSALGAAAIYTPLAWLELRRLRLQLLGESHALLALGFATLAVPLALSARLTACTWAIEGAAVLWLGLRQQRRLPRWIGYTLQAFAGLAFLYSSSDALTHNIVADTAILNGDFFGALLIALAGLISAYLLSRRDTRAPLTVLLFVWGWFWWLVAGGHEIDHFAPHGQRADWSLALFAFSGVIGAEAFRRLAWREAAWPALAAFLLAPVFVIATTIDNDGPLESWGAAAWAFWLLASLRALTNLAAGEFGLRHVAHLFFVWSIAFVLGVELGNLSDSHFSLGYVWTTLAVLAPFAALFWFTLVRAGFMRWPDAAAAERLRKFTMVGVAAILGLAWCAGIFVEGDPAPLPYIVPLLNPLELAQLGFLMLLLVWYRRAVAEGNTLLSAEARARILAIAGVVWLTAMTLRGAHFLGNVPWSEALWHSALAQAALSIVWTSAGIAAMLLGKQRGSRAVWLGGAALMGVVIAKLLLIDRAHLHDLAAIVGVLVVGVLLVAVGYFAPAPPRTSGESA